MLSNRRAFLTTMTAAPAAPAGGLPLNPFGLVPLRVEGAGAIEPDDDDEDDGDEDEDDGLDFDDPDV